MQEKSVENAFRKAGDQLARVISETVNNNLDLRLTQLRRQIQDKESGQQDREKEMQIYTRQKADLDDLKSRLDQLENAISALSDGRIAPEIVEDSVEECESRQSVTKDGEETTSP